MKRFLNAVVQCKVYAGLGYAVTVCVTTAAYWLLGSDSVPISMLVQLLLVTLCSVALSCLCFSPETFGRMRYTLRLALFLVLLFGMIAAFAVVCDWFPVEHWQNWLTFTVIFFAVGGLMTLGFEVYFRISGNRYDGLLNEYRKNRGKEDK